MKKIVNYPIKVPDSDYCWDSKTICQFYDNEGGHSSCDLYFFGLKDERKTGYVLKAPKCQCLETI